MIDVAMQLAIQCLVPLEFIIFKAVPQNIISYVGGIPGHTSNKLLISLVSHAPATSKLVTAAHASRKLYVVVLVSTRSSHVCIHKRKVCGCYFLE